jgi:hypothetical protein
MAPDPTKSSEKETRLYAVRKTLERDSIDAAHKIRDYVIRPLSKYAVILYYIPAASRGGDFDRREKWYNNVLISSGFKYIDGAWIPANWGPIDVRFTSPKEM